MALNDAIKRYLNETHHLAYDYCKKNNTLIDEPSFISAFIQNHKDLENKLNGEHSNNYYILDAIYAHQTPKVQPTGRKTYVEIADLLLINIHHEHLNKSRSGRAMLLQAKRSNTKDTGPLNKRTEATPFHLYTKWPKFHFRTRASHFTNEIIDWDFQISKTNEQASKYLIIYKDEAFPHGLSHPSPHFTKAEFKGDCTWNSAKCEGVNTPAGKGISCNDDFSDLIAQLLQNTSGRSFNSYNPKPDDHWSIFIHDMLNLAKDKSYIYNLSRQGILEKSRYARMSNLLTKNTLSLCFAHVLDNYYSKQNNHNFFRYMALEMLLDIQKYSYNSEPPNYSSDNIPLPPPPPSHPSLLIVHSFDKENSPYARLLTRN